MQRCEPILRRADRPQALFVSATLLREHLFGVPDGLREQVLITYPYWLPQSPTMVLKYRRARFGDHPGIQSPWQITERHVDYKMNTMYFILGDVLSQMRKNWYRDYLLDRVSLIQIGPPFGISDDSPYEHIGFEPGQHFIAKGCNIVQITHGANPKLERKADWVIQ